MNANRELELRFGDNTVQRIALWSQVGEEFGAFITYGGRVHYGRARQTSILVNDFLRGRSNGQGLFPNNLTLTPAGRYWQTTTGASTFDTLNDGSLPQASTFGWRLALDATASNVLSFRTDDTWNYSEQAGRIELELWSDQFGRQRCDFSDPSCIVVRRRVWQPVANVGGLVYVLESETRLQDGFVWDPALERYSRQGEVLSDSSYQARILPRLTAYFLRSTP